MRGDSVSIHISQTEYELGIADCTRSLHSRLTLLRLGLLAIMVEYLWILIYLASFTSYNNVSVERDGHAFKVAIVYEKHPNFCNNCRSIGHSTQNCQKLVNSNPIVQKNLTKAFSNAITAKKSSHPMLNGKGRALAFQNLQRAGNNAAEESMALAKSIADQSIRGKENLFVDRAENRCKSNGHALPVAVSSLLISKEGLNSHNSVLL